MLINQSWQGRKASDHSGFTKCVNGLQWMSASSFLANPICLQSEIWNDIPQTNGFHLYWVSISCFTIIGADFLQMQCSLQSVIDTHESQRSANLENSESGCKIIGMIQDSLCKIYSINQLMTSLEVTPNAAKSSGEEHFQHFSKFIM